MQTLLLFSHTFWDNSKVNKALLESAKSLPNLTIHNLNTAYPNGAIDVAKEVELLEKDSYDGHHGYSLETILTPLTSTFKYCGCNVLESYAIFSAKVDSIPTQEYLSYLG